MNRDPVLRLGAELVDVEEHLLGLRAGFVVVDVGVGQFEADVLVGEVQLTEDALTVGLILGPLEDD